MKKIIGVAVLLLSLVSCQKAEVSSSVTSSVSSAPEVVNYTVTAGLAYDSVSASDVGDMYVPNGLTAAVPGVVLIHGGAFKVGNEKMFATTAKWLANHGFAVYCVNYRPLTEKLFPGAVSDIKGAVRYLRKNASAYSVDPEKIVCWGESAGAYLAVMATMTGIGDTFDGDVSGDADIASTVNACVDFYGPCCVKQFKDAGLCNFLGITADTVDAEANSALVTSSDPTTYAKDFTAETAVKMIIQHGGSDTTVSNQESQYLYAGIKDVFGEKASLEIKDGLHHMDSGFYTDANLTAVTDSLSSYFSK